MSDNAEWLRRRASQEDILTCEKMLQAADEIARLQDESRMLALCEGDRKEMADTIARLQAEKISLLNWLNTHHPHVAIAWAKDTTP